MADRTVRTRWTGGMRAVTRAGDFEIVVDEPASSGGTNTGPQPTDLFLASVAACFALSIAWVAKKRAIALVGLDVIAEGQYDGLRFERISLSVSSAGPRAALEELIPEAERLCYVSNTLRQLPELTVEVG